MRRRYHPLLLRDERHLLDLAVCRLLRDARHVLTSNFLSLSQVTSISMAGRRSTLSYGPTALSVTTAKEESQVVCTSRERSSRSFFLAFVFAHRRP
jgi:hypothetical protein